ncbi:MAG: carbamoyl phosphate synthase small subunit [Lachnospirales bacterium]
MKGKLVLENGKEFYGNIFGYDKNTIGEVVFNTSMTGYQEILTDPSYSGQIVTMTYPLIGNYGINLEDNESTGCGVSGFIVKEKTNISSNWRREMELDNFLKINKITAIEGVDTRAITKTLRNSGTMKGYITTNLQSNLESLQDEFNNFNLKNIVEKVSIKEKYTIEGKGKHLVALDFGTKTNIFNHFSRRGLKITVVPFNTSYKEIMALQPDIIFLSNGPGDPEDLPQEIATIKKLIKVKPIFGICLGHQLIALATNCTTRRMKFGHHGGNHGVKDLRNNKIHMTSQNHEYVVDKLSEEMKVTYINVNDKSIEGISHKSLPVFSVQFHPEASPGPMESQFIFDEISKFLGGLL